MTPEFAVASAPLVRDPVGRRSTPLLPTVLRRLASLIALGGSIVLAACGGGTDAAVGTTGAAVGESLAVATGGGRSETVVGAGSTGSATVVTSGSEEAWTLCALEGQTCTFSGTRRIRYGTPTVNAIATYTSQVSCTNGVFGDPAVGTYKSCWYENTAATVAPTTNWTLCAGESQFCAFSGTRTVRYGTQTSYFDHSATDGVACTNAIFGDPAVGTYKSCWVGDAASTPTDGGWTGCASESQFCAFSGTRSVRYGTATNYVVRIVTGGVACSNTVFGDPAVGIVKSCSYSTATVTPDPAPSDPAASGTNPPIVFNASASAHAGDVVGLQGQNFGNAPRVYFDGAPATALEIVNQVGTTWLAVQIPASAQGALVVRIANGTGISARVALNAARPLHLDTTQLVPGGAFRIFGRSLMAQGGTPTVKVDGLAATVDPSKSDETMLTATAPAGLAANASAAIVVDNGNGSGAATLDRAVSIVTGGSGDAFGLGVGWGAAFAPIAASVVDAATDSRLGQRVACDGARDDTAAIQAAIDLAAANGGATVRLPAGRCRMAGTMNLRSRVVVKGAGKTATELVYASNYPVYGVGLDLAGLTGLKLTNAGSSTEGPLLKDNTRVFVQNVAVQLNTSRQMYLTGNRQFVVQGSDFVQTGSISGQGPYVLNDNAGLVFEGNTTRWVGGAPAFGHVHDSYVHANRFTRDASNQSSSDTIHSLTIDFAYRLAVVGNTLDVANGPITNKQRNDGEAILTEGGGAGRTENLGTIASATATTFADPSNTFDLDPFATGAIPENYGVAIVGGTGAGQTRRVVSGSGGTLTVDRAWDVVPDGSSHYATFVWGLEKATIKDNVLSQNPRGIWLYHTAVRDVDVVGNTLSEGGGIYLRSYQNLATRSFMPLYNIVIAGNTIRNTTGQWMSYVDAVFVNADARAFGTAFLGIEMKSNTIVANRPNVTSNFEEYANLEGFMNMMRVETYASYEASSLPRLLGTLVTNNTCDGCDVAVRIGTGAGGTTILNTRLVDTPAAYADWATTASSEKSTATVIH